MCLSYHSSDEANFYQIKVTIMLYSNIIVKVISWKHHLNVVHVVYCHIYLLC